MDVFAELAVNVLASVILLGFGFLGGKYRERRLQHGRNLEEYDFYPFDVDENKNLFLDLDRFSEGVTHLLRHRDRSAAEQLLELAPQTVFCGAADAHDGDPSASDIDGDEHPVPDDLMW